MLQEPGFPEVVRLKDVLALLFIGGFFLFLGLGAIRLRRIRRLGLEGHEHRRIRIGDWELVWPGWWPDPEPAEEGWLAGPLDHDGRLQILPETHNRSGLEEADYLQAFLESRLLVLDEFDPEIQPGKHGEIHLAEGRAKVQITERGYLWTSRIPGPHAGPSLVLLYRASVLYGFADGFWLNEVARRAEYRGQ